jgi:hypothetical protein
MVEAERKTELKRAKSKDYNNGFSDTSTTNSFAPQSKDNGFFNPPPPPNAAPVTNNFVPLNPQ